LTRTWLSEQLGKAAVKIADRNGVYFGGGFLTKSMPFSMLVFRPLTATSRSFFSCSVIEPRMLTALSAPAACIPKLAPSHRVSNNSVIDYPEFNWYGEEVNSGSLGDGIAAGYAREIHKGRLNNAFGSLDGLDDAFGKPAHVCLAPPCYLFDEGHT
jgi:hypothetical protein